MSLSIQPKPLDHCQLNKMWCGVHTVVLLNLSMLHFMWMNFACLLSMDKLRYRIPSRVWQTNKTNKKINPHKISPRRFLNLHAFGTFDFLNCIGVTFYLFKIRVWCEQKSISISFLCVMFLTKISISCNKRHIFRIYTYIFTIYWYSEWPGR